MRGDLPRPAPYEWCLTEHFDPQNEAHLRIKKEIETGNGLPDIAGTSEVCDALRAAGFELLEGRDVAAESDPETPWYRALQGRDFSLSGMPRTPAGRFLTNLVLRVAERVRVVPKGTAEISRLLNQGRIPWSKVASPVFSRPCFSSWPANPVPGKLRKKGMAPGPKLRLALFRKMHSCG